jgi:hypothetical protein
LIIAATIFSSCAGLKKNVKPSDLENVAALRDLLNSSTFSAIKTLSQLSSNNPETLLPPEIAPVLQTLRNLGMAEEIDKISVEIGAISKLVLDESQVILADAINQTKFNDALAAVVGGQDAATQVLRNNMKISVKNRYSSLIDQQLEEHDINTYWPLAQNAYNLFSRKKIEGSLSDIMAEAMVDVIFTAMGKQETELRNNPSQIGTDVAMKVFTYYQKQQQGKK